MTKPGMVKYPADAVLPVLEAADRPLTTAEIGERCREAHGRRRFVDRGPDEVADALKTLEKRGTVVSAMFGHDDPHEHIVGPADARSRWWATADLAERWRAVRGEAEARGEQARRAAEDLRLHWGEFGFDGVPPHATWAAPDWPYTGPAEVIVHLDGAQATALLDLLYSIAAHNG
jgi:hypothetical protein